MSNHAQEVIHEYMRGKIEPGIAELECFVAMIEVGQATWNDLAAVGGDALVAHVAKSMEHLTEDGR